MAFGLMNIAFNFDQLAKALKLAYSGEAPVAVQAAAPPLTQGDKDELQARDLRRYMQACESYVLVSTLARRKSVCLRADPDHLFAITRY